MLVVTELVVSGTQCILVLGQNPHNIVQDEQKQKLFEITYYFIIIKLNLLFLIHDSAINNIL